MILYPGILILYPGILISLITAIFPDADISTQEKPPASRILYPGIIREF